jgi:hypothetical protein
VEHDAPSSSINTFPEAMTAAFLTAATLGFGRQSLPVTQDGQIIAAVIVFFALGLWGFASSNLTRMWLHAKDDELSSEIEYLHQELNAISEQLRNLADGLLDRQSVKSLSRSDDPFVSGDERRTHL